MTRNDTEMTPKTLNSKQLEAARTLALGGRELDAANEAGVSLSTIKRWKRLPGFQDVVEEAQQEIHQRAMGQATRHVVNAMRQIVAIAQSDKTPAAVRLAACRAILDYVSHHLVTQRLEARLTALEGQLEA